jgi:hypothetical protein
LSASLGGDPLEVEAAEFVALEELAPFLGAPPPLLLLLLLLLGGIVGL